MSRYFRWSGKEPQTRKSLDLGNGWDSTSLVLTAAKLASREYGDRTFTYAETVQAARSLMDQHGLSYPGHTSDPTKYDDDAQRVVDMRFGDLHRAGIFIDCGPDEAFVSPEETEVTVTEGAVTRTVVAINSFERNVQARRQCIARYGTACSACGIDFGEMYGDVGKGFIHVHHLTPLSAGPATVNAIRDLRPICPNCHAMVHRTDPPMSIEALRSRITSQRGEEGGAA